MKPDSLPILGNQKPKEIAVQDIAEVFELSRQAFDSPEFAKYIEQESTAISNVLWSELREKGVEYLGCFGVGFPFYSKSDDGFIKIDEISNFIAHSVEKVNQNDTGKIWECPRCQYENNLSDLKSACGNCNLVNNNIKPIKVLATMPDIDLMVITKNSDGSTLGSIQQALLSNGYAQFDTSIGNSFDNTKKVLEDLKNGKNPESKLPIDLHVLTYTQLSEAAEKMAHGEQTRLRSPALHVTWEDHELPIWFDFVFSLHELGQMDPELSNLLAKTRKDVRAYWGDDALVGAIKNYYPRGQRLFETQGVEAILRNKLKKW